LTQAKPSLKLTYLGEDVIGYSFIVLKRCIFSRFFPFNIGLAEGQKIQKGEKENKEVSQSH
jgi:hypothetical protein